MRDVVGYLRAAAGQVLGPLGPWGRLAALLAAAALVGTLFLPLWWIHLSSGQYPEGLDLFIYARDVKGNLQSINTLNHYIGMKPVEPGAFSEFTWLTPVLGAFAGLALVASIAGRREVAFLTWMAFIGFEVYMLARMHHWLWVWGHELDPRAPFRVEPFMPPLLGFRQIANFGVVSLPGAGGLLMITSSILGPLALWLDWRQSARRR